MGWAVLDRYQQTLAQHFLERYRREFRKPTLQFSEDARTRLANYPWPGNVRELQNAVERAAILSDGQAIDAQALELPPPRPAAGQMPAGMLDQDFQREGTLQDMGARALQHIERFKIETPLRECKWNKTRAVEKLGVSYKTLLKKICALGLEN